MKKLCLDKQLIEKLYIEDKLSVLAISKKFNCSQGTISNYLKEYDIKAREFSRRGLSSWNKGIKFSEEYYKNKW